MFLVPNQNKGTEREPGPSTGTRSGTPFLFLYGAYSCTTRMGTEREREHVPEPFRNRARPRSIYTQSGIACVSRYVQRRTLNGSTARQVAVRLMNEAQQSAPRGLLPTWRSPTCMPSHALSHSSMHAHAHRIRSSSHGSPPPKCSGPSPSERSEPHSRG